MIAEGVLTLIFLWLLYWIDLERKLNGRPGIPLLGVLFDSVQINVSETFNDKSIRGPAPSSGPAVPEQVAPPPQAATRRSVKAVPSRPVASPVTAVSPGTVLTEDQIQETSGTATTTSDANTDNGQPHSRPKKKKRKKKRSTTSKTSKGSKNKKRTRRHHKKKSGKSKKREKEATKESPPHEDTSIGTDSELTPDVTQTETYDPSQHHKLPVPDDFNPGRNPSDATAQSGETFIDEDKKL
uniref:Uncharacterized protein n=1 Tax=Panagrellus redivivus TaxID=6233 RepID=A0A7E4WBW5_PANRE